MERNRFIILFAGKVFELYKFPFRSAPVDS